MRKSHAPSQRKRMRPATRSIVPSTRARTFTIPRGIRNPTTGFPAMMTVKHKYVEDVFLLTQSSGAIAQWLSSCNGMFDPNTSLGGHQPLYFDQLSAIYNHYTVVSSKITYKLAIDASSVADACTVGCYIEDDSTGSITIHTAVLEQPSSVNRLLTREGGPVTLTKSWNARQAFGGNTLDNDELKGSVSANPVEQQHYELFVYNVPLDYPTVRVQAEIVYTAVWRELKPMSTS